MEGETPTETASAEEDLKQAQDTVQSLYDFRSHYFEHHGVECATRKESDTQQKMQETLALLEKLQDALPRVQYWYLRGKALNVVPDYNPEVEQCLSRAVKHDPSLVDAWNCLGESYWKMGNVQQAHDCFTGSLAHSKSKESLRNLSMVLRQMGREPSEREAKVRESLQRAKEAVAMDVKDGTSWMVLGNAYLSLFFMTNHDPKLLKQCVSAYNHAEKDPVTANNPDLHFNRATLCLFEEDYGASLQKLSLSATLDPAWGLPREKADATRQFLTTMAQMIAAKGKLKAKRLSSLVSSLTPPEQHLGPYANSKIPTPISELREGENGGKVLVGAVAATISTQDRVPYACVLVDSTSNCVGLTVYNLAISTHFSIGELLAVPDPTLRHTTITEGTDTVNVDFWSLRVTSPAQLLLNGRQLSADKLALPSVSITAFS